jgi:hypothetical protein
MVICLARADFFRLSATSKLALRVIQINLAVMG